MADATRHLGWTTRERLVQRPPDACSRPRAGVSVEPCPPRHSPAVGRAAAHVALAAMRATTHVVGKLTRSSRRARRGAGYWSRTTIGASGRTPISTARLRGGERRRARRPLAGAHARDGRRGGGRVGSATLRTINRTVRPRPPVAARVRPRLRSSAGARTARSRVVQGGRLRHWPVETLAPRRRAAGAPPSLADDAGRPYPCVDGTLGGSTGWVSSWDPRAALEVQTIRADAVAAVTPA